MQAKIFTTADFRDKVRNLILRMTLEGDVFGIGRNSEMTLGGGACRKALRVMGISVGGYQLHGHMSTS